MFYKRDMLLKKGGNIMNTSALIVFGGVLSTALAIFHCFFYYYFKWEDDLKNISFLNGRIFITFHLGLIAVFLFFASLSFFCSKELSACNGLAGIITGFYAFLWWFRLFWQVTYLKGFNKKGKFLHYILLVWFLLLAGAYTIPVVVKVLI